MTLNLTESTFEKEVNGKLPVLVDFWAEWCGPCKRLGPVFEELSKSYAGKLVFAKVNVDSCPTIAQKFGISAIPNLKLFKNGKVAGEIVGALSPEMLKSKVDSMLK